jgi:agmatine/peptidylarginine deiminase
MLMLGASSQPQVPLNPWTPPEYFPSKAVLIEWDFNQNTWPLYSELIGACREAAEVIMVVRDLTEENQVKNRLIADSVPLTNISFVHVPCERMWIRDHGPLAVWTDSGVVYMDFDDLASSGLDEDLPTNLANAWGLDSYQLPYILDGGNFMVNNFNTLFTTTRLYTNNPGFSPTQIRNDLETFMGITNVVTVSAQHNDYWGHIDMQIKLLDDSTFVVASVDPGSGPNYDTLENNYQFLASLTAPNGKPYRIRRLLMADNWKTYANSLILNNTVLIPTYNHIRDSLAFMVYKELLPNHLLVGINCNSIIGWDGALHCITMQLFDDQVIGGIKSLSVRDHPVRFFPNPIARNQTGTILWNAEFGHDLVLMIVNNTGQVVQEIHLSDLRPPLTLDWQHPAGVYVLKLCSASGGCASLQVISVQ